MVVLAMTFLLMTSLAVMLYYSRKAVKEEAFQKASATLDGVIQHIDNVLLSVEQSCGNTYFSMLPDLNRPEKLATYCRKLVETNPYVSGCAIAFKPGYFKDHPYFMAYVHHAFPGGQESQLVSEIAEEVVLNDEYVEQPWFSRPMNASKPGWQRPMTGDEQDEVPILTFCLPIPGPDGSTPIGVMGLGVTLSHLSSIIEESKTSANSFCMLLESDGTFIVHPVSSKLQHESLLTLVDQEGDRKAQNFARAMVAGESGHGSFRLDGTDYYIFYKPFHRSSVTGRLMEKLHWGTGIVFPKDDILGDSNRLFYMVLAIAVTGLLLLFVLCRIIIHRQLKPLTLLTESAQRIAKGDYDEQIGNSSRKDELGRLQNDFNLMQQSLASSMGELDQLKTTLQERNEHLHTAYNHAQKANRMKTVFLHNMTNQMISPAEAIVTDVDALSRFTGNEAALADDIQQQGDTIADVLKNLITLSDEEIRKEATHV